MTLKKNALENTVGRGENAGIFSLFAQCFFYSFNVITIITKPNFIFCIQMLSYRFD